MRERERKSTVCSRGVRKQQPLEHVNIISNRMLIISILISTKYTQHYRRPSVHYAYAPANDPESVLVTVALSYHRQSFLRSIERTRSTIDRHRSSMIQHRNRIVETYVASLSTCTIRNAVACRHDPVVSTPHLMHRYDLLSWIEYVRRRMQHRRSSRVDHWMLHALHRRMRDASRADRCE